MKICYQGVRMFSRHDVPEDQDKLVWRWCCLNIVIVVVAVGSTSSRYLEGYGDEEDSDWKGEVCHVIRWRRRGVSCDHIEEKRCVMWPYWGCNVCHVTRLRRRGVSCDHIEVAMCVMWPVISLYTDSYKSMHFLQTRLLLLNMFLLCLCFSIG